MDIPIKNQSTLLPKFRIRLRIVLVSHEDAYEEQKTYQKVRHLGFRLFVAIALICISAHSFSRFSHSHGDLEKELKLLAEEILPRLACDKPQMEETKWSQQLFEGIAG